MFKEKLIEIANNKDLKASAKSINQTQRNQLMNELLNALFQDLTSECEKEDLVFTDKSGLVNIARVDKAIEFSIDNEKIGFIPLKISVSLPNFDNDQDIFTRAEDFVLQQEEKLEKENEKKRLKEEKIKADIERRKKVQELKEKAENKK